MFVGSEYEKQRQAVINSFNLYENSRKELLDSTDQSDGRSEQDLQILKKDVELVAENKYLLTIVGESKSGKSAFINGLLKRQILPTGILQCTSGIIEILDTDNEQDKRKVYLKVKYANSRETEESDIPNIQEKLKEIAQISEEYRSLPVLQLNQFLIDERPQQINDQDINTLLSRTDGTSSRPFLENPHQLDEIKFKHLIKEYLEEYRDLSKISVEIIMGYPLGFKSVHLRIVDTPGVNARGGLKDATFKSMLDASAVIFIHPIKNIASESLKHFIDTAVPNQVKDNIFMFLTHKAQSSSDDIDEILKEAKKLFPNIKDGRIIAVDSILKRIHDELLAGRTSQKLYDTDEVFKRLIAQYRLDYNDDQNKISAAVYKASNFALAENILREFSEKALSERLSLVVAQISGGYKEQKRIYEEVIHYKQSKITKTAQEFDKEINTLKENLENYRSILNQFSTLKRKEYSGLNSGVNAEFYELKEEYVKLLENAADEDAILKYIVDFNKDCEKKVDSCITKLNEEYTKKMEEVGEEFRVKYSINTPNIGLKDIADKAREAAYVDTKVPGDKMQKALVGFVLGALGGGAPAAIAAAFVAGGGVAGPIGAIAVAVAAGIVNGINEYNKGTPGEIRKDFDQKKYKDGLIREAKILISTVAGEMVTNIAKVFDEYDNKFQEKLSTIIDERQEAYENLKNQRQQAGELQKEIEQLSYNLISVDKQLEILQTL
ncbi:hypothetical protein PI95_007170 [Hassallia byssoidea VB512170]|uniref:Dynamin N-terminal domain-containing protein n=1 Tax=Hassallia byssoidea VB512170 TaxID=1304833 RepID=A0A846H6Z8_9CYAN|nr:dynamin family protein [Hassalia byssoidea]NEU72360.1 hypothetical protein [Hassalia byssoidea VB512170]